MITKTVVKNVFRVGSASIIASICSFFLSIYIVRILDPSQLGVWSSSLSIATAITFFIGFGLPQYYLKSVASGDRREDLLIICLAIIARSFSWIVVMALCGVVIFRGYDIAITEYFLVVFLLPYSLGQSVVEFAISYNQANRSYIKVSFWHLAGPVMRIMFVATLFFFVNVDYYHIVFAFSIAGVVICLFFAQELLLKKEYLINTLKVTFRSQRVVLKKSIMFGMVGLVHTIYVNAAIVLARFFSEPSDAGYYAAAQILIVAAALFPAVVVQKVLMPDIHLFASSDQTKLTKLISFLDRRLFLVGAMLSCLTVFSAPFVVNILYGEQYAESVFYLQILSLSLPFRYAATCYGAALMTKSLITVKARILAVITSLNVLAMGAVLSLKGPQFVCYVFVFVEALLMFVYYFFYRKNFINAG